jgi:hypothetical protein
MPLDHCYSDLIAHPNGLGALRVPFTFFFVWAHEARWVAMTCFLSEAFRIKMEYRIIPSAIKELLEQSVKRPKSYCKLFSDMHNPN